MAMQKRITSAKPIICLGIMLLCLLTGMDDILGFWQPLNLSMPVIQSGTGQDDGAGQNVKSVYTNAAWSDAIDVAQQLSFSQTYLEEIKWQVSLIYLRSSHDRAPPAFSYTQRHNYLRIASFPQKRESRKTLDAGSSPA